ncbi:VWA-like domain-containing protein [Catenulispora yoronensis]|uniref:VWA-like domain-containing protein n=2 Tax=Catenulispora yoronensis TaxID=450799 RepID=A0ABP5FH64_9ACTN
MKAIPTPAVMAGRSRLTARPVFPITGATSGTASGGTIAVPRIPSHRTVGPAGHRAPAADVLDTPKLLAARHLAVTACPYLAVALHAMAIVPTYAVRTMAVDRYWRCYVNPGFVSERLIRELAAVWLHEVSHLVRDHHGRADRLREASVRHQAAGRPGTAALDPEQPARERIRLNIAMDLEINDDLLKDLTATTPGPGTRPRLPAGALTPQTLRIPQRDLFEEYLRDVTPSIVADHEYRLDCGSGAHDASAPWEADGEGAHPLGKHEAEAIRISVRDALNAGRGTAPNGWKRWAERHGKAPQDWRTLLGAAFRTSLGTAGGAGDYTYRRPSRRGQSLGSGLILPSLLRRLPHVAVVIDTSGSVSDEDLGSALTEVAAITRATGVSGMNVSVYSCDAAVHTAQRVCQTEDIALVGGGGTDLRLGIRRAASRAPRPDVVVVLTDGDTPWPETEPGCRVIAGLFGSTRRQKYRWDSEGRLIDLRPPSWVETVELE